MRVMMAPYTSKNPNQKILKEKLEEKEVDVIAKEDLEARELFFQVLKNDVDVFHLNWADFYMREDSGLKTMIKASIFAFQLFLIKIYCDKLVWTSHNKLNHERNFPKIDKAIRKFICSLASEVQVWDQNTKEILVDFLGVSEEKLAIIPYGNYIPPFKDKDLESEKEIERRYGFEGFEKTYLYFGAIRPYKQVGTLIDEFKESMSDDHLLIVAGNPLNQKLDEEIRASAEGEENIYLDLEFVPEKRIAEYAKVSDFAVFPYKDIFNSGSIVMSLTLSLPFIAPDKGVVRSYSPEGNIIYKRSLKEALRRSLDINQSELREISESNRKAADTKFSWDEITDKTIDFYS